MQGRGGLQRGGKGKEQQKLRILASTLSIVTAEISVFAINTLPDILCWRKVSRNKKLEIKLSPFCILYSYGKSEVGYKESVEASLLAQLPYGRAFSTLRFAVAAFGSTAS